MVEAYVHKSSEYTEEAGKVKSYIAFFYVYTRRLACLAGSQLF